MFGHMGGFGMGFGWFFTILIFVFIGLAIFKYFERNEKNIQQKTKQPLDILKERYAKGELSDEEFERKKKNLDS